MPILRGNIVNVRPGDRCFSIDGNLCDMFRLGERGRTGYLLDAEMTDPEKEFIFNGLLFMNGVSEAGTVIDSFPKVSCTEGMGQADSPGRDRVRTR